MIVIGELKCTWKVPTVSYFMALSQLVPVGTEGRHETSVRITDVRAVIWTWHLENIELLQCNIQSLIL